MHWSLPKAVCFIRRLYSSPSFNRQPPAKGVYNVLEAGVYRGLARYAWLRMVRNQEVLYTLLWRGHLVAPLLSGGPRQREYTVGALSYQRRRHFGALSSY